MPNKNYAASKNFLGPALLLIVTNLSSGLNISGVTAQNVGNGFANDVQLNTIDLPLHNINFQILSVDTTTNQTSKMGGTEKRRKQPVEPASITKGTALSAESNRKTESDGEQEMGVCFLCGARDAALCKACGVVYVCPLHISYHQVDLIPP